MTEGYRKIEEVEDELLSHSTISHTEEALLDSFEVPEEDSEETKELLMHEQFA